MRKTTKSPGEKIVKDIKRRPANSIPLKRRSGSSWTAYVGEDSIAELCRREGISQDVYYKWSKDFME